LPIAGAFVVGIAGVIVTWSWETPEPVNGPVLPEERAASVAVMPFDVLGDDPSQTFFAEGISLDLITELSRVPGLLVIAPGTVFAYRKTAFERAIALVPEFAPAYAGLALAWSRLAIDGWTDEAHDALSKAIAYAHRAASIDPSVPQIHFVKAQVALFRGQHEKAASAATRAIELDPNHADAYAYALLAWILHYAGRPDQAEPMLAEALQRNPRSSASYREIAGEIAFATGRYTEAVRELEAALERNPAHTRARLWLAATLARLGRHEEAAWQVQELLTLNPDFSLSRLPLSFPRKDPRQRDALARALAQLGLPR
jgi:tetratricopeptide (TPR) repeat protein